MKKILDSVFNSPESYVKNARDILTRLSVHKNKLRIKEAIDVCRDYLTNFQDPPIYKICAVKFLKDLFDEALFYVIELVEQAILPIFVDVILYRQEVKSFKRGYTFLLSKVEDSLKGQDVIELMSKFVKPSKSYYQLVHECVFFWAQYIEEENSKYKLVYESVKHCTFPTTFKHFSDKDTTAFKQKYKLEQNAVEYQLEDCFKKWEQTKQKLKQMEKKDYVRQKLEDIYNWIESFVTEYTNLLVDLKNSHYYQRKGFKQKMLSLLVQKKQFLKLYIECVNKNSFNKLFEKYGKYEEEQINEQFGLEKSKKVKRKKIVSEVEDPRLTDIKKIYLADYPEALGKFDIMPIMMERYKHYAQYKKGEIDSPSRLGLRTGSVDKIEPTNGAHNSANNDSSPSQRLKSSFVSNGLSVLNGNIPQQQPTPFLILPMQTVDSKRLKNTPQMQSAKKSNLHNQIRSSLNNEGYRSELLKNQRKVNASVGVMPKNIRHSDQQHYNKSSEKNHLRYKI